MTVRAVVSGVRSYLQAPRIEQNAWHVPRGKGGPNLLAAAVAVVHGPGQEQKVRLNSALAGKAEGNIQRASHGCGPRRHHGTGAGWADAGWPLATTSHWQCGKSGQCRQPTVVPARDEKGALVR